MPLLTAGHLDAARWTLRAVDPVTYRLDLTARPGHWLEVRETVMGWHAEFATLGLHQPYGTLTTVEELDRFVARIQSGRD